MDVLRTVAHELTHALQHERESLPDTAGDTGSPFENEANARAGILMREYAQLHPEFFAQGLQEATAKSQFNKCYQTAQKLFQQAEKKNLNPILYQVAGYKGNGEQADANWLKVPQEYWQHYVTVIDNVVLDPTAKQFGPDKAEKYSMQELQSQWDQMYQILPKETFN
jgi:glycyl-tRNA synthetase (class II)